MCLYTTSVKKKWIKKWNFNRYKLVKLYIYQTQYNLIWNERERLARASEQKKKKKDHAVTREHKREGSYPLAAWRSIMTLTLISHSTLSTDRDQRHAVNTALRFWRFKITTTSVFLLPANIARCSGNPVTIQTTTLLFIFEISAGTRTTTGLDDCVYAKNSTVESRWRCIVNRKLTQRKELDNARARKRAPARLGDDNKSSRRRWRGCLWKAPEIGRWIEFFDNGPLLPCCVCVSALR